MIGCWWQESSHVSSKCANVSIQKTQQPVTQVDTTKADYEYKLRILYKYFLFLDRIKRKHLLSLIIHFVGN